jgi:glycosyltransferase involved in cell wall biosynthesis
MGLLSIFLQQTLHRISASRTAPEAEAIRRALRSAYDAADFEQAKALIAPFVESLNGSIDPGDRRLITSVEQRHELVEWTAAQPAATAPDLTRHSGVLHLLAYSLPHTRNGFGYRSHGVAQAIAAAGWRVQNWTVPGYPGQEGAGDGSQSVRADSEVDGVIYRRLGGAQRRTSSEFEYLRACSVVYEDLFARERPAVVHAAVGYFGAVPALLAARRLGIPFVLEMRGFWEVMRACRQPAFERTASWNHMRRFRNLVAQRADHVLTLTEGMRQELIDAGADPARVSISPNCVDSNRFVPMDKDLQLAAELDLRGDHPVVGYLGSVLDYEGLDDLISALAALRQQKLEFSLLIVGDGPQRDALKTQAGAMGIASCCRFAASVPQDQASRFYSLMDICVFPRKPWEICRLVSPLKPLEAMACKKAVLVADVTAMREMVRDGVDGSHFTAGDVGQLAIALRRLIMDAQLRRRLGEEARLQVSTRRAWSGVGISCDTVYRRVIASANR